MEIADFIALAQEPKPLRFLVIGGYAVVALGHARTTFDVDFLIRRGDRAEWERRATAAGLHEVHSTPVFTQFAGPGEADALDLMCVEDATFFPMWDAGHDHSFGGSMARIPCLDHLLALKLHALRHAGDIRFSKDAADIEALVRRHTLDLRLPHYRDLFRKYGTPEIHEVFVRLLRHG